MLDRGREGTSASHLRVQVDAEQAVVTEVADALEASPAVAELARVQTFVVDGGGDFDLTLIGDPDGRRGVSMDRPIAVEGRLPSADAPDEVALNEFAARTLGLGVGDVLSLGTFAPEDVEALLTSDSFQGFNGPDLGLQVVGVARLLEDLQGGDTFAGPQALVGPAFFTDHADVGGFPEVFSVRLTDPDTGAAEVEEIVTELAGDADVSIVDAEAAYGESIGRAVDVLTAGLLVFTLVAVLAGLLVVAQAVSRQVQAASADDEGLRSLGVPRAGRAMVGALPTATAATVGAVLAGLGSVVVSPMFLIGLAREVEVDRGMRVDPFVAVAGAVLLTLAVVAVVGWRSWRHPAASAERTSPRLAGLGRRLGIGAVPPSGRASPWSRGAAGGPFRSAPPWSASPWASSGSSASAWSSTAPRRWSMSPPGGAGRGRRRPK